MELLQYEPTTRTTYETPIPCSPPWINKYYVMDLAPGRSFIQRAVDHGHTVFAISYLELGQDHARGAAGTTTCSRGRSLASTSSATSPARSQANVVGLRLGGTLTTFMLIAYLDAIGDQRVRSATLLNTLIDFSKPGVLGIFTDRETVERLEAKMARQGYLEGEMALTFDLLRANDLIWNYVASNWLMGEDLPAFDILAWNADSTRMPCGHALVLPAHLLPGQPAGLGRMELAGVRLHLDAVTQDSTWSGRPTTTSPRWKSSYNTTQLVKGHTRFVLSSSGATSRASSTRPAPRRATGPTRRPRPTPDVWLAGATEHAGSWWDDWSLGQRSTVASAASPHPWATPSTPIADAPAATSTRSSPPRSRRPATASADAGSPRWGRLPTGGTRRPGPSTAPHSPHAVASGGALEDGGDALAAADAHGDQGAAAAGALQLVQGLDGQDVAGRPDGVAQGDARPVGVGAVLGLRSRTTASAWAANASLTSNTSMSSTRGWPSPGRSGPPGPARCPCMGSTSAWA